MIGCRAAAESRKERRQTVKLEVGTMTTDGGASDTSKRAIGFARRARRGLRLAFLCLAAAGMAACSYDGGVDGGGGGGDESDE